MNVKIILLATLLFGCAVFSQSTVLSKYPENQSPYIGGYTKYYKDFHDIIVKNNLQPCLRKTELYQFKVLITSDSTIKFIKDVHEDYVEANKCAYHLAREVAKHQDGWNPAVVDGVKQDAIAEFIIYPDDFFNNFRDGYRPDFTNPVYYEGDDDLKQFGKELNNKIDLRGFDWKDVFTVETEFIITKEGKMEDLHLVKNSGMDVFDRRIIYGFKNMRKKWKPATINGTSINFKYKYTLKMITDLGYN